jgi:hypothetical protein
MTIIMQPISKGPSTSFAVAYRTTESAAATCRYRPPSRADILDLLDDVLRRHDEDEPTPAELFERYDPPPAVDLDIDLDEH